jgi:hypothetical protein
MKSNYIGGNRTPPHTTIPSRDSVIHGIQLITLLHTYYAGELSTSYLPGGEPSREARVPTVSPVGPGPPPIPQQATT